MHGDVKLFNAAALKTSDLVLVVLPLVTCVVVVGLPIRVRLPLPRYPVATPNIASSNLTCTGGSLLRLATSIQTRTSTGLTQLSCVLNPFQASADASKTLPARRCGVVSREGRQLIAARPVIPLEVAEGQISPVGRDVVVIPPVMAPTA